MRFARALSRTFAGATTACVAMAFSATVALPAHAAGLGDLTVTTSTVSVPNPDNWQGDVVFAVTATSLDGAISRPFSSTMHLTGPATWSLDNVQGAFAGDAYCITSVTVTGDAVSAAWSGSVCTQSKPKPTIIPKPTPATPKATPKRTATAPTTKAAPRTPSPTRAAAKPTRSPARAATVSPTESPTATTTPTAIPDTSTVTDTPVSDTVTDQMASELVDGERPAVAAKEASSGDKATVWWASGGVLTLAGVGALLLRRFD